jgi:hypothetical protein
MNKALKALISSKLRDQQGVTVILVAVLMSVLLGFTALAIDLSNLYVVRNELQNSADAGALAGARFLYNDDGAAVNPGANLIAYNAARDNRALAITGAVPVDVNWSGGNAGEVQRGHWSFTTRTFTANDSLAPVVLWDRSWLDLDMDPSFINAVRVVARRQATPAASFFARIFGYQNFQLSAEAVAYLGFAGSFGENEVDQPIAICIQSITDDSTTYGCNTGRMLNSGQNIDTSNTGAWTNFSQPCETASVPTMRPLICGDGNPGPMTFYQGIGTVNGVQDTIFRDLEQCWVGATGGGTTTWEVTLPVIDCPSNAISNCGTLLTAVTVKVVWVQRDNPGYRNAPTEMHHEEKDIHWPSEADLNERVGDLQDYFVGSTSSDLFPVHLSDLPVRDVFYQGTEDAGRVRWASFVKTFDLRNVGSPASAPYATLAQKSIYFLPSCTPNPPLGDTGGPNTGILAKIPKLVK